MIFDSAPPAGATPPVNDDCGGAISITFDSGSLTGTTVDATITTGSLCGDPMFSPDVWYTFAPQSTGRLSLSTCPTLFPNVISVFATCPGGPNTEIACSTACPALCGPTFNSCLSTDVQ